MKDQIIKYLQGIQCEWFPLEWDLFIVEWLVAAAGYGKEPGETITDLKIKYEFTLPHATIHWSDKNEPKKKFYYGTLDRCKLLLLNAVRSVDEPKWKGKWGEIFYLIFIDESGIRIEATPEYGDRSPHIIWENGEFK